MSDLRAYGYFDGLYLRPADISICETPGEVELYLDGHARGMEERDRMARHAARQDAPGPAISVPMPQMVPPELRGPERNRQVAP